MKKLVTLVAALGLFTFAFTGCGSVNSVTDADQNKSDKNLLENVADSAMDALDDAGDDVKDAAHDAKDDVKDVAHDAKDKVNDVADNRGTNSTASDKKPSGTAASNDKIDASKGFNSYDEARDYLIRQMGYYDNGSTYEVRNENRKLVTYDDNRQGYEFEVYDTTKGKAGKRMGTYYVDKKKGTIYQKDDAGKGVEAVEFSQNLGTSVSSNKKHK